MPFKSLDVEKMLTRKLRFVEAKEHSSDHRWYELHIEGLPIILTKVSHSKRDLGPNLLAMIARQMRVKKSFLEEPVRCTKSAEEYEEKVRTAPVPPFDVQF